MKQPETHEIERAPFPRSLPVRCQSRWPNALPEDARRQVLTAPLPSASPPPHSSRPEASVIVPTCGQEVLTRLCLASVLAAGHSRRFEVIVVDNDSVDGTRAYLRELSRRNSHVKLILNPDNKGFAAANNQALRRAEADLLVLLNNDTIVSPGWLQKLELRLEDPQIGMVGCLTNRSGGENEIEAEYNTYGEFLDFADQVAKGEEGPDFECTMLPLCCAALRRDVFDRIGPLDEGYGLGLFEDDDLCLRLRRAGYRITVAGDCYIHHFGQSSMGTAAEYAALLTRNRQRFETKWGIQWEPRGKRRSRKYREMTERIRKIAGERLPPKAAVAVISRGDDELLRLGAVRGEHFMQDENGVYWGAHPVDGEEAIARWERLRRRGAEYLLVPETGFWWLTFYDSFRRFLDERFEMLVAEPETCRLYRFLNPERHEKEENKV